MPSGSAVVNTHRRPLSKALWVADIFRVIGMTQAASVYEALMAKYWQMVVDQCDR